MSDDHLSSHDMIIAVGAVASALTLSQALMIATLIYTLFRIPMALITLVEKVRSWMKKGD